MARRMSRRLVALSTAAIAAVYSVGYVHTQPVAAQLAAADSVAAVSSTTTSALQRDPVRTVTTARTEAATTSARFTLFPAEPDATTPPGFSGRLADGGRRSERNGRGGAAPSQFLPVPAPVPSTAVTSTSAVTVTAPNTRYRDGTYTGMGENRHGDVQVNVTIAGGRIASAAIAQCGMQYPCSRIAMLPGEVLSRQNTNVDLVSGATMSSTAYQEAVMQALAKAAG